MEKWAAGHNEDSGRPPLACRDETRHLGCEAERCRGGESRGLFNGNSMTAKINQGQITQGQIIQGWHWATGLLQPADLTLARMAAKRFAP